MSSLEQEFQQALIDTIRACRKLGYDPKLFARMVAEQGGAKTARALLFKADTSDGFSRLYMLKRLDLSMEAHVLQPRFRSLFTDQERRTARERLADYGYVVPEEVSADAGVSQLEPSVGASGADDMAASAIMDIVNGAQRTGRTPGRAHKGSQHHLQDLVNAGPELLNAVVLSASPSLRRFAAGDPFWVSPLEAEDYREYQDRAFLAQLGIEQHADQLADFWPKGGPVWDGLAMVPGHYGRRGVLLLEAKSHVPEMHGQGCQASEASRARIARSLERSKEALGARPDADWLGAHYQMANRLAHLFFLNMVAHVPAWLVYLYFVGDTEQGGPLSAVEWETALQEAQVSLGMSANHLLADRVVPVFLPVQPG